MGTLRIQTIAVMLLTFCIATPAICQEGQWQQMDSGTTVHLYGIWGLNSSDVYAVGQYGTVLHYDGSAWSKMSSETSSSLFDIWGISSSTLFAVGKDGTILSKSGGGWDVETTPTTEWLNGVWGTSNADVFAVGNDGVILHYDGDDWQEMYNWREQPLNDVWGRNATDVYAVGEDGLVLYYNGSGWSKDDDVDTEEILTSVWHSVGSPLVVTGEKGTILKQADNGTWSESASGTFKNLTGLHGNAWANIFATGENGLILRFDGSDWITLDSGSTQKLNDVWTPSSDEAFAVGKNGTILYYSATSSTTTSITATSTTTTAMNTSTTTTSAATTTTTTIPVELDFVGSPTSGYRPLTVNFTDLSKGSIRAYHWDFGDGSAVSEMQNPTHTYSQVGTYSVILTVELDSGDNETLAKENYITVEPILQCPFEAVLDNQEELNLLRLLRNTLRENDTLARFVSMYYRHSPEINAILIKRPDLARKLRNLTLNNLVFARRLSAGYPIKLPTNTKREILGYLADIAREGSDGLKNSLKELISVLNKNF